MQMRRKRPVAALTLALIAAPFLAATAVAASEPSSAVPSVAAPAKAHKTVVTVSWLSATTGSVQKALDVIAYVTAERIAAPVPAKPVEPIRAQAPPPPAPVSDISDPGTWTFPADGPITSPFGRRWGRRHDGADIDAAYGSAVVAPQRGVVITAGWGMSGYGRVVEIDHGNGITTLYAHLSSVGAVVGQVVAQGDYLGAVGESGSVTAAHLHYEVHINGVPRNPMPWLTGVHSTAGNPG
jgi:murein DD-endopeptidase MepM/ murein hydrolase activator NlpD